jgi:hypothetical protein
VSEAAGIRQGQSCAADARTAVRELHAAIAQRDTELVIFFCSGHYDLDAMADEMSSAFGAVRVVGCTTAGEIGPAGYCRNSLTGASFPASQFMTEVGCLEDLEHFEFARGQDFVHGLQGQMSDRMPEAKFGYGFAFQMIDGLSVREEPVTRIFQHALGMLPLIGGSAGDGLDFESTHVYFDGRFRADSAVLALIATSLPVRPIMSQHFVAFDQRVVVTEADASKRVIREIDGRPAAQTYAALLGVDAGDLDSLRFAAHPMLVMIGGEGYVRSISKVLPDGSLKFFCAVDEGMVLRIAGHTDLVGNLANAFATIRRQFGEPQLILGCDCVLRQLEAIEEGVLERVAGLMTANRVVGFSTYGEQYRGVHVNQTFTGVAIGCAPAPESAQ